MVPSDLYANIFPGLLIMKLRVDRSDIEAADVHNMVIDSNYLSMVPPI